MPIICDGLFEYWGEVGHQSGALFHPWCPSFTRCVKSRSDKKSVKAEKMETNPTVTTTREGPTTLGTDLNPKTRQILTKNDEKSGKIIFYDSESSDEIKAGRNVSNKNVPKNNDWTNGNIITTIQLVSAQASERGMSTTTPVPATTTPTPTSAGARPRTSGTSTTSSMMMKKNSYHVDLNHNSDNEYNMT